MTDETPTPDAPTPVSAWYQRPAIIGAMVTAGLLVGLGIGLAIPTGSATASAEPEPSPSASAPNFGRVAGECKATGQTQILDDSHTLILDGRGSDDSDGLSITQMGCILTGLDTPDAVIERMSSTRALDGMQAGEWGAFSATWSYHPDTGLKVIIETAS